MPLKGQFQAALESDKRFTNSVIHVVKGNSGNLSSAKTAQDLRLIQLVNKVTEFYTQKTEVDKTEAEGTESTSTGNMEQALPKSAPSVSKCTDQNIQQTIDKHEIVFIGEKKLKQVKLHIDETIKPVVQPQRRIPYHLRNEVSKELRKLIDADIIKEARDQPTP